MHLISTGFKFKSEQPIQQCKKLQTHNLLSVNHQAGDIPVTLCTISRLPHIVAMNRSRFVKWFKVVGCTGNGKGFCGTCVEGAGGKDQKYRYKYSLLMYKCQLSITEPYRHKPHWWHIIELKQTEAPSLLDMHSRACKQHNWVLSGLCVCTCSAKAAAPLPTTLQQLICALQARSWFQNSANHS